MKRREFMNFVGLGILASSLPVAIAACNSNETASEVPATKDPAPVTAPDGFEIVGSVADLDTKGFLSKRGLAVGNVIIVRDPANADSIIALNSKCTHQGCTVDWQDDVLSCACHGSEFAPDGTVNIGPAVRPLDTYEATVEGETVLIKSS